MGNLSVSRKPCWPIDTTYFVDELNSRVDFEYFWRFLTTQDLAALNQAAAIPGLNRRDVYDIRVPLPPLKEQKRIAAILDKADRLRSLREEAIVKLDQLAQSIFLEMFGDPVANPKGWDTSSLAGLGAVTTGNTPPRGVHEYYGNDIEWIKSDNISEDYACLTEADERLSVDGARSARTCPIGSVLVTCIAGSKASIGKCAIADRRVAFNQQINAFTPHEKLLSYYYYLLRLSKRLVQEASTQSMKGLVSKSAFSKIEVVNPPWSLKTRFETNVDGILEQKKKAALALDRVQRLEAALTQRAFKGDL